MFWGRAFKAVGTASTMAQRQGKSIQGTGKSKHNGSEEGNCLDWGDGGGGEGLGHHWRLSYVV